MTFSDFIGSCRVTADTRSRRDMLTRLGDALDAADASGSDEWPALFDEYLALATKRALATPLPKVKIKSTADYWHADEVRSAAYKRTMALKAEIETCDSEDRCLRSAADLQAAYAAAYRDWQIIAAAVRNYNAAKRRSRAAWRRARRLVRIPQRDRVPQR